MKVSAEELIQRIKSGEDLGKIVQSLIPPARRELLKRCAVVRLFDEQIVNEVLMCVPSPIDGNGASFEDIQACEFVEPVPRTEGFYRLRSSNRQEHLRLWWDDHESTASSLTQNKISAPLKQLSESLVDYYERQGEAWSLEKIYHLVVADQENAHIAFLDLYIKADRDFDLTRCANIIATLEERFNLLSPVMTDELNRLRSYLRARNLWTYEYYLSIPYYERPKDAIQLNTLLNDEQQWILQLHAPGGSGKTMFIRWLIARQCVPQGIPCAQVDFDFLFPDAKPLKLPSILLQITEQLDKQIHGSPFYELINNIKEFLSIAAQSESTEDTSHPMAESSLLDEERKCLDRFASTLHEVHGDKPVIFIFDTLEDALLHQQGDIMSLVKYFSDVRKKCPGVRLILSGRYDLRDKIKKFASEFIGQTREEHINLFNASEARGYLQTKRGLTDEKFIDVIVNKSNGSPFMLSVYADLIRSEPDITVEHIARYEAELIRLIKRIIERIKDPFVRWVVRYGVIPRKLTLEFIKDIMKEPMICALRGDLSNDDPRHGIPDDLAEKEVFPTGIIESKDAEPDLNNLWVKLCDYASRNSWVMLSDDRMILTFHRNVLNPMRQLLQDQPIFRILHNEAITYYEKRAQEKSSLWDKYTREAIYHKFQLEGASAAEYWRAQMKFAKESGNTQWELSIATEITGPEYLDEDSRPRMRIDGSSKLVLEETIAEAYFEVAQSNLELARYATFNNEALWSEIQDKLKRASDLQARLGKEIIPKHKLTLIRAAVLTHQKDYKQALSLVQQAQHMLQEDSIENVQAETQLGDILNHLDQSGSIEHYERALELADRLNASPKLINHVFHKLARIHSESEDFEKAYSEYLTVCRSLHPAAEPDLFGHLSDSLINILLGVGWIKEAQDYSVEFEQRIGANKDSEVLQFWNDYICARVSFLSMELLKARQFCERLLSRELPLDKKAKVSFLLGNILEQLMDYPKAIERLEKARSYYKEIGDADSAARCLIPIARIQMRGIGDINEATTWLDKASRSKHRQENKTYIGLQLLQAELFAWNGKKEESKAIIDKLIEQEQSEARPSTHVLATIATEGLVQQPESAKEYLNLLINSLKKIDLPSARLYLVKRLSDCEPLTKLNRSLLTGFKHLFETPSRKKADFAILALNLVEVYRIVGDNSKARALLRGVESEFENQENYFGYRECLLAGDRLGGIEKIPDDSYILDLQSVHELSIYKTFLAAMAIEQVERKLGPESEISSELMKMIDECLEADTHTSQCHFRYTRLQCLDAISREDYEKVVVFILRMKELWRSLGNKRLKMITGGSTKIVNTKFGMLLKLDDPDSKQNIDVVKIKGDSVDVTFESWLLEYTHTHTEEKEVYTITLSGEPGQLAVGYTLGNKRSRVPEKLNDHFFNGILETSSDEIFSYNFMTDFRSDWVNLSQYITLSIFNDQLLYDAVLNVINEKKHTDFELEIQNARAHFIPWEFLNLPLGASDEPCFMFEVFDNFYRAQSKSVPLVDEWKWIQSSLQRLGYNLTGDGFAGKQTEAVVKEFQLNNQIEANGIADKVTKKRIRQRLGELRHSGPQVLILQPSEEQELGTSRGASVQGLDLRDVYARCGIEALVMRDPAYYEVESMLGRHQSINLIHASVTLNESPSLGGVYMDFAQGNKSLWGGENIFSSSAVSRLLNVKGFNRPRPVLVLDVPRPPGLTEILRQLFLRNAFAGELFHLGKAPNILATGLGDHFTQRELCNIMVSLIGQGESLGDIAKAIRMAGKAGSPHTGSSDFTSSNYLQYAIPFYGTALFTQDPTSQYVEAVSQR